MKKLQTNEMASIQGSGVCPDGYRGGRTVKVASFLCIDAIGWGWCNVTTETQFIKLCTNKTDGSIFPVLIK